MLYQKEPQDFRVLHTKNLYFKTHFHPQTEVLFCTKGEINLFVEDKCHKLLKGDCAVIFPNQPHSYIRSHEDDPSEAYLAIIPLHYVDDYETELDTTFPKTPLIHSDILPSYFELMFSSLLEAFVEHTEDIRMYKAISNLLLACTIPKLTLKSAAKSYDIALTPRILNYLAANLKLPLSLGQVARTFGISKNTLSSIFKQELHTTYLSYLNNLRLESAKKLLKKTSLSIASVSSESGFQSERSFYRFFHRQVGCTPSEYRRQFPPSSGK